MGDVPAVPEATPVLHTEPSNPRARFVDGALEFDKVDASEGSGGVLPGEVSTFAVFGGPRVGLAEAGPSAGMEPPAKPFGGFTSAVVVVGAAGRRNESAKPF